MNYPNNDDKLQRVRNILSVMDRSIDAARAKRENPPGTYPAIAHQPIGNGNGNSMEKGEPRLPTSIFDRKGPMLKARPKRTN